MPRRARTRRANPCARVAHHARRRASESVSRATRRAWLHRRERRELRRMREHAEREALAIQLLLDEPDHVARNAERVELRCAARRRRHRARRARPPCRAAMTQRGASRRMPPISSARLRCARASTSSATSAIACAVVRTIASAREPQRRAARSASANIQPIASTSALRRRAMPRRPAASPRCARGARGSGRCGPAPRRARRAARSTRSRRADRSSIGPCADERHAAVEAVPLHARIEDDRRAVLDRERVQPDRRVERRELAHRVRDRSARPPRRTARRARRSSDRRPGCAAAAAARTCRPSGRPASRRRRRAAAARGCTSMRPSVVAVLARRARRAPDPRLHQLGDHLGDRAEALVVVERQADHDAPPFLLLPAMSAPDSRARRRRRSACFSSSNQPRSSAGRAPARPRCDVARPRPASSAAWIAMKCAIAAGSSGGSSAAAGTSDFGVDAASGDGAGVARASRLRRAT